MTPSIRRLGESALELISGPPASLDVQRRIWAIAAQSRGWPGVCDAVPAMNNLTLFIARDADVDALEAQLRTAWHAEYHAQVHDARVVEIPVVYGGNDGPDLSDVARRCKLTTDDVIALHSAREYVVFFMGFQPGFAYLGGLDARLHLPRRAQPRSEVPAGSVGIAGEQTGIYPLRAPGGWHLIGRTAVRLFEARREPPSLLAPGDRVRFVPVTNA